MEGTINRRGGEEEERRGGGEERGEDEERRERREGEERRSGEEKREEKKVLISKQAFVPTLQRAVKEDLPDSFTHGFSITGIVADTDLYLDYLINLFRNLGGSIVQKEVLLLYSFFSLPLFLSPFSFFSLRFSRFLRLSLASPSLSISFRLHMWMNCLKATTWSSIVLVWVLVNW